jgi:hypothetical protein
MNSFNSIEKNMHPPGTDSYYRGTYKDEKLARVFGKSIELLVLKTLALNGGVGGYPAAN